MPGPTPNDFGDDDSDDAGLVAKGVPGDNAAPLTITEISQLLKRTVEERFSTRIQMTVPDRHNPTLHRVMEVVNGDEELYVSGYDDAALDRVRLGAWFAGGRRPYDPGTGRCADRAPSPTGRT